MTQARVIFWVHHWLIVWTNTWWWKCADLDIVRFPLARHRPVHPGRTGNLFIARVNRIARVAEEGRCSSSSSRLRRRPEVGPSGSGLPGSGGHHRP